MIDSDGGIQVHSDRTNREGKEREVQLATNYHGSGLDTYNYKFWLRPHNTNY